MYLLLSYISVNYTFRCDSLKAGLYFVCFNELVARSSLQRCVCTRGPHYPAQIQGPTVSHEVGVYQNLDLSVTCYHFSLIALEPFLGRNKIFDGHLKVYVLCHVFI